MTDPRRGAVKLVAPDNGAPDWPPLATSQVSAHDVDALIIVGGYGVVKNICTYAADGVNATVNPDVQRLLGVTGDFGTKLGVSNDYAYKAIKAVGNYGEVWDRNVGPKTPLRLERGRNALVANGGLMMSIPVR